MKIEMVEEEEIKPTGDGARSERQEHSPLPWRSAYSASRENYMLVGADGESRIAQCMEQVDARFVLRSVTAHHALVEAARFAASVLKIYPMEMSEQMAIEKLDAALALVDGPQTKETK